MSWLHVTVCHVFFENIISFSSSSFSFSNVFVLVHKWFFSCSPCLRSQQSKSNKLCRVCVLLHNPELRKTYNCLKWWMVLGERMDFLKCKDRRPLKVKVGLILWTPLDPCFIQSPDTKVINNCYSTSHLSPKPVNNIWDYHYFVTAICAINQRRLISSKIALASVMNGINQLHSYYKVSRYV